MSVRNINDVRQAIAGPVLTRLQNLSAAGRERGVHPQRILVSVDVGAQIYGRVLIGVEFWESGHGEAHRAALYVFGVPILVDQHLPPDSIEPWYDDATLARFGMPRPDLYATVQPRDRAGNPIEPFTGPADPELLALAWQRCSHDALVASILAALPPGATFSLEYSDGEWWARIRHRHHRPGKRGAVVSHNGLEASWTGAAHAALRHLQQAHPS